MRIIADPGGAVTDYVERFEAAHVSGAGMTSPSTPSQPNQ
jgi:hypothetical protein